jgi:hypothetical protein
MVNVFHFSPQLVPNTFLSEKYLESLVENARKSWCEIVDLPVQTKINK